MEQKKPNLFKLVKPLTKAGHRMLAAEYDHLFSVERPKVVDGVATAAAEGDRSENAEYIYGKKRLREIDKRLRYLGSLLKDCQIVDPTKLSGDRISFAATVRICDTSDGEEKTYTLVGEGETDHNKGYISWKSPVGKALFGRKVGDVINVQRPKGDAEFEVCEIMFLPTSFS